VLTQSVGGLISVTEFTPAQTFTAGASGLLSQIDVQIRRNSAALGDMSLEIWPTMNGAPTGASPLYSKLIPNSSIPTTPLSENMPFTSVDVRGGGLQMTPGDKYAIALRSTQTWDDPTIAWSWGYPGYSGGDPYSTAFGRPWESEGSDVDFAFKTWVEPPPRTGALGPNYRLLESAKAPATPAPGMPLLGIPVDSSYYSGVNFEISETTRIKRVGGNFITSSSGQVFAAIVKLSSINGAPSPPNLSGTDVIGHTLISLPSGGFSIADASAPLDMTLEPGFYGLWFGSGRFGATGTGTLYSQNPDVGSWYSWTQPQPSGSRGYSDARTRMFIDAASAPATVQLRPTQDAAAVRSGSTYALTESSETPISVWNSVSQGKDERAVMEFDLRGVPKDAIIEAVTLDLRFRGRQGNGSQLPQISFHGYAGDGVVTPSDAATSTNPIGVSPTIDNLVRISTSLSASYVQSLLGVSTHLGLVGIGSSNGLSSEFDGSEARNTLLTPLLTISYSMPSDFNDDGFVDGGDLAVWKQAFGKTSAGDVDKDGDTDGHDFLRWQRQSTGGPSLEAASAAVPEPASSAGCAAMLAALAVVRGGRSGRRLAACC
jgi:hypothetical protein